MTSPIQPTISPADRVAPQRAARTANTRPGRARSAPTRRPWFAATILSVGMLALVGGGLAGWQMLTTGEVPKPRMAAIKLGPLPEMPDLRDGVPALMSSRTSAAKPDTPGPATVQVEDANRKAMASTVAAANLRPALAAVPAIRVEAEMPKPAVASASANASVVAAEPAPVRQVDIKRPTETASIGIDAKAPVATSSSTAAPSTPGPAPRPVEGARDAAPAAQARVASLPVDAPLPPRKPSMQTPDPAQERAAERPVAPPKPRPIATPTRPAAPPQAVASAEPRAPASSATVEEERSILGVPVPRFVPTGRDIRDAAASVGNAITSIPDNF